jgi:Zn-dependent protease with chaperone function/Zn-finger nucleic acid-binding protein
LASISIISTYLHYKHIIEKTIPQLPLLIGASVPNKEDPYHKTFCNITEELCVATGVHRVHVGVIPSTAVNALAISDGREVHYVIVTEGLLARLDRPELESVIAHEFSHVLHGDAMLTTLACSLFGIFEQILEVLKTFKLDRPGRIKSVLRTTTHKVPFFFLYLGLIKIICVVSIALSRFVTIFISRQREMLADATSVQLTRNPLGLAEALYKISQKWRGSGIITPGLSPLFIMNPAENKLDEHTDWFSNMFSTHPPLSKRLDKLLSLAKDNISSVQTKVAAELGYVTVPDMPKWWVKGDDSQQSWLGPYTTGELKSVVDLVPLSWVCKDGTKEVKRLKDESVIAELLAGSTAGKSNIKSEFMCPRCSVNMYKRSYENADIEFCVYCKGHLVTEKNFIKILARHDEPIYMNIVKEIESLRRKRYANRKYPVSDSFPGCKCPGCSNIMPKTYYSMVLPIVIEKCKSCGLYWFDEKELEYINSLIAVDDNESPTIRCFY